LLVLIGVRVVSLMVWRVLHQTVVITAFVAVMMLAIEYINVRTRGVVMQILGGARVRQYLLAVILGGTPGCLGAFVVVALYLHRKVSIGAVVAAMLVTSGDEMFVMLSLFPGAALAMTAGLAALGIAAGSATDLFFGERHGPPPARECSFDLHRQEECRARGRLKSLWRPPSAHRATLTIVLVLYLIALIIGHAGSPGWGWMRITLVCVTCVGLLVVTTVPDHFLEEHLWQHVFTRHVPRVFLWTLAALAGLAILNLRVDLRGAVLASPWTFLGMAGLVGLIPESGPHLVFSTMFAEGAVPLSVLLTSSAVQDGHGMLPLLAHSRKDFLKVKLVNLVAGMLAGSLAMSLGF
jgi:hypothetical protein